MLNFRNFYISILMLLYTKSGSALASNGGLPQLDLSTYPSLIFWSIVSLFSGYILMRFLVTPNIKSILNSRETSIQNDLVKAKTSNNEAAKIKEEVLKNKEEIKLKSLSIINDALVEAKKLIEKNDREVSKKLDQKISTIEKKIFDSEEKIINEVISKAEDITINVVKRLTNLKCQKAGIQKAVETASKNILKEI